MFFNAGCDLMTITATPSMFGKTIPQQPPEIPLRPSSGCPLLVGSETGVRQECSLPVLVKMHAERRCPHPIQNLETERSAIHPPWPCTPCEATHRKTPEYPKLSSCLQYMDNDALGRRKLAFHISSKKAKQSTQCVVLFTDLDDPEQCAKPNA